MPSRAVLKKKARREAKRQKQAADPPKINKFLLEARVAESQAAKSVPSAAPPKRGREDGVPAPKIPVAAPVAKRARPEILKPEPIDPSLPRKERKRLEAQRRLEKQMSRLQTPRNNAPVEGEEGEAGETPVGDAGDMKERHDPRFKNGTFWRDRKERRARTVFLGGIPFTFTVKQVTDFIMTILDADLGAVDYLRQLEEGTAAVEEVDMLPSKHGGKVKHMYVTMASVGLAGCATAVLDGYKIEGKALRCNFAADKSQRAEAIKRRDEPSSGGRGGRGRGFRGGRGGGRGRGFGGNNDY